jgi:sugar phosphate permease
MPGAPAQRRWWLPLALAVSTTVGFLDRLNLSLALPSIGRDYHWTVAEIGERGGALLAAFFVGYALSNVALSPLAARLGPRRALIAIVVLFSGFTALGAPAAGASLAAFTASRLCLGLAEGPHFPMMSTLIAAWFPSSERSRANGLWIGGAVVATIVAPLVVVPIIGALGWRAMLIAIGGLGLAVTLPVVWRFVHDRPAQAPWLGADEAAWLAAQRALDGPPEAGGYGFLRAPAFWLIVVAGSLNNFVAYGVLNWLPTYFSEGRGVAPDRLGYATSLPYASGLAGVAVAAWLGDRLHRRAAIAGAGFAVAAGFVGLAVAAADLAWTIALFAAAVLFQSAYTAQEFALLQRVLPARSVSTGSGIYNGIALLLGGGLGSFAVGRVVAATGSYDAGMWTIAAAAACSAAVLGAAAVVVKY